MNTCLIDNLVVSEEIGVPPCLRIKALPSKVVHQKLPIIRLRGILNSMSVASPLPCIGMTALPHSRPLCTHSCKLRASIHTRVKKQSHC